MAKTTNIVNKKKKRGRPSVSGKPGVQSMLIGVRLPPDMVADLDRWRSDLAKRLGEEPNSRPEAIRAILEGHFQGARSRVLRDDATANRTGKRTGQESRRAATDMAAKVIDDLTDPSASVDDRDKRKRRLLKGPQEFRDLQRDAPTSTKRKR
jgi:hypothetical protein